MIRAMIIDEEVASVDKIRDLSKNLSTDISIEGVVNGKEALSAILQYKPDLIFLDGGMPVMHDIEVIEKLPYNDFKLIFTSCSSEYAFKAIKLNALDYLLKPIEPEDFLIAMKKVRKALSPQAKKKTRIIGKKGVENVSINVMDIVYFFTEKKIVHIFDKDGNIYLADKNLNELQSELDPLIFFRANRQYIINLNFIKHFKAYEKVKLVVELSIPDIRHFIIISQKKAPEFRNWVINS